MSTDHVGRAVEQWRVARPDLDASPVAVIGRLTRIAQHVHERLVAGYRELGLSEGEFDILASLRRTGADSMTPTELTAVTFVTKGAVTKRLDQLVARGLVVREQSPTDGRGRVVRLTDAGRDLIDAAMPVHLANERAMLADLTPGERATLERILASWAARIEARP